MRKVSKLSVGRSYRGTAAPLNWDISNITNPLYRRKRAFSSYEMRVKEIDVK
jgi:hypothetical protein